MAEFECWFCGGEIERTDAAAVMITVENLWLYAAGSRNADDPVQSIFAHANCARQQLRGVRMEIHPEMFGEDD